MDHFSPIQPKSFVQILYRSCFFFAGCSDKMIAARAFVRVTKPLYKKSVVFSKYASEMSTGGAYTGPIDTNPATEDLGDYMAGASEEIIQKVKARDAAHRAASEHISSNWTLEEVDQARRKRIIYRSKQRGFLECDLLLGSYARIHVPNMSTKELDEMEILLREETLELFNFITGKAELPAHLKDLSIMEPLLHYSSSNSIKSPKVYAQMKSSLNLI